MAIVSTGIQITFSGGFCGELVEVGGPSLSRVDVNVSHHLSTWHTYLPGEIIEGGALSCTVAYNPQVDPPIASAIETVTFIHPDVGAKNWTFDGYMNSFELRGSLDINYVAEISIKVAGPITYVV